jgi:hypothetical protein
MTAFSSSEGSRRSKRILSSPGKKSRKQNGGVVGDISFRDVWRFLRSASVDGLMAKLGVKLIIPAYL